MFVAELFFETLYLSANTIVFMGQRAIFSAHVREMFSLSNLMTEYFVPKNHSLPPAPFQVKWMFHCGRLNID